MLKENRKDSSVRGGFHVQFNLLGLVVFSVSLVIAAGLLASALVHSAAKPAMRLDTTEKPADAGPFDGPPSAAEAPAWGEFVTQDIQLERPEEYTAMELENISAPTWTFAGMNLEGARRLMSSCGLTPAQIDRALLPKLASVAGTNFVVHPDRDLVFSLSAEVRARLYTELGRNPANHYMCFPFCFPGNSFDQIAAGDRMKSNLVSLVRPLLYRRGETQFFSDFEAVIQALPSEADRLKLIQALSCQSAVLVRVRVRPTTDLDKLLGYWTWAPGVRLTNLRPLLESLQRLDEGGTVSLLYFLPHFARERLYTYPLPSQPGDPAMDCHWSTLNFFNDPPDNRLADPTYASAYLSSHCYRVAKPTRYGDLIFLVDDKGGAIHSAVYLADDIVFTKNGNNYMEPWMLMRISSMLAHYSIVAPTRMIVYRTRDS